MGKTIVEKVMAMHSTEPVVPGSIIWIDLDVRSARDFGGANVVKNFNENYPEQTVADTSKTCFTFDCNVPANNIPYANNQQTCRKFAEKHNLKVFDVNRGIGSHIAIEEGQALPATTIVGTDSHLNILGAVGSFGQGMGDQDIAFAFRTGKTWFEIPHSMKVIVKGNYSHPVTAKDLTLRILKELGSNGALGLSMEYEGEAINNLDLAGRITLASMATEMGAIISFITPNEKILSYLSARSGKKCEKIFADSGANYVKTITIDVNGLEPLAACPYSPENVKTVREVAGRKVDSVFIGSCTNGRFEDFEMAANLVKGRKIASHVMAKVVPATREVFSEMLKTGVFQTLFDAGFIITSPGCGGCASGQIGMTGKGEVQISTSNRNFKGKQGDGDTYLASPLTAAASALTGKITDPRDIG
ncbi:MAG: 3-isopropylmalate dehydratase large subunit [Candidatus Riflebacteria bacterium]|nr:3-isopropylmalate dehydratase large subunit [Candidatus Riflebacteria bacterium]